MAIKKLRDLAVLTTSPVGAASRCPRRSALFAREHTHLRREPAMITCPNCLRGVETMVERRCTDSTHLSALLLLPVCCCALPYCAKATRDAIHRCPSCGIALGACFASARELFVARRANARQDQRQHAPAGRHATDGGEAPLF